MDDYAYKSNPPTLCNTTLAALPSGVVRPNYNRDQLTPGIVHIGLGNFHRAHQAWYLHRLMQLGLAHDWAIIGGGVRAFDEAQRQKLEQQDFLTTLVELDPASTSAEVVGSMIGYAAIAEDSRPLIQWMANPGIRIVSLTITEGGYYIDPVTRRLDEAHPDIVHDIQNPSTPRTAFGAIIEALRLRQERGHGPFTGLCCDNLQSNGDILRQTVLSLAQLSRPEFAQWIDDHCSFPNSMVDCIVPATGPAEIALARELGIDDAAPVTHERFRQWVIEDRFCAGRPALETVGVVFTDAVHDYEKMKIRILNAGHQVIANAGELLGLKTIADCMAHPLINGLFTRVEHEEIAPYVKPVPGITPESYIELIASRFANPSIQDTTRRVSFDGSSRHPGFILPILREALDSGGSISGLALVEALWARMCAGIREDGSNIESNDPFWEQLNAAAHRSKTEPEHWLRMQHLYGDLADNQAFSTRFSSWLSLIWDQGVEATITSYCNQIAK